MKKLAYLFFSLAISVVAGAQLRNSDVYEITEMNDHIVRTEISIPGFADYQTLKCDFHIHTIFSDGKVWPDVRVTEAWRQGLDAIAITDHIEYRPNKNILKGDLNESFKIAKKKGDNIGFIVIKGTEITRSKPLGHLNALFLKDVMPMEVEDPLEAIEEALRQEAFIMWNHPGWPDDKSTLYPVHEQLIRDKKIHGIEVFNHKEYYPVAFDWCKNMKLAYMANSDIHDLVNNDYGDGIRPMTLVFAKEKSEAGIREALFAGRTAAYFDGKLVGPEEYLRPLVKASFKIRDINGKAYEITNTSSITYRMTAGGKLFIFPAGKTYAFRKPEAELLVVENCFVGTSEKLTISLDDFLR